MATSSLFQKFLAADKALDLKTGDFARAKKALSPELLDLAVVDGVVLRKKEGDTDTYSLTVRLSRRSTKVADAAAALDGLEQALQSKAAAVLRGRLLSAPASEVDAVKDTIVRYAKLVQSAAADVHWYRNVLENPHTHSFTDAQRDVAREMCRELGIRVKEYTPADVERVKARVAAGDYGF